MRVLYISYDGAGDPLGQSQVVPYVEGLARRGYAMTLMSFEKREHPDVGERLHRAGVRWIPLRYHRGKAPLDLALGYARARMLGRFDLVHARSYPACLIAWRLGLPYIFDVRGFYPEERVDGGLWPKGGALFRITKALEKRFDANAKAIVTLTHASVPIIAKRTRTPVTVIPTCVDLTRFVRTPGIRRPLELAYVGSLGTWYLADQMFAFARVAQRLDPDCRVRFVTNDPPDDVCARAQLDPDRTVFMRVSPGDVPKALEHATATFFFIMPAFSKLASAATKLGETLALGLPCVINPGVGDSEMLVREHRVGVIHRDHEAALTELRTLLADPGVEGRCRALAESFFSLDKGVERYAQLYDTCVALPHSR